MNHLWDVIIFLSISQSAYCWEWGGKVDAQRSSTSNVNLTASSPIKDSYNAIRGYVQTKNDIYKVKLKVKNQKYKLQNSNDNYLIDLSLQYKNSQYDDYTIGIDRQVYDGPTIISTDTTSDNLGGRFSADFSKDFNNDIAGYLSLKGNHKKYSKILGRSDNLIGSNIGIEYRPTSYLMINPELTLQKNYSTHSYYRNSSYTPYLLISFNPNKNWEIFTGGSYTKINYSDRIVSVNTGNLIENIKETQSLVNFDFGASYKITKNLLTQINYSIGKNSSNNPLAHYTVDSMEFGIALKF